MCKDSRGCNWLQNMKLHTLFPLRSPRALRSIGNANQSQFRDGLTRWVGRNSPVCCALSTFMLLSFALIIIKESV